MPIAIQEVHVACSVSRWAATSHSTCWPSNVPPLAASTPCASHQPCKPATRPPHGSQASITPTITTPLPNHNNQDGEVHRCMNSPSSSKNEQISPLPSKNGGTRLCTDIIYYVPLIQIYPKISFLHKLSHFYFL